MPYLYYETPAKKFLASVRLVNGIKDKRILAFSPHSDDLSIGAGGFLVNLAKTNSIKPILAYTGFRGVLGKLSREEATRVREEEFQKEAGALGIESPLFLRLRTYDLDTGESREADKLKIKEIIKQERPSIVFLPNPLDLHPRHRLLSRLVLEVLEELHRRIEIFFYEIPWSVFSSREFNFIVPLSKKVMAQKISAIKVHTSQLRRTDFVRMSKALLALRAGMVPEQKLSGYGSSSFKTALGNWVEVYKYKTLK